MNDFIQGFFYPVRCIKLFFIHPKLILYSIVPMLINLIIYGTILFYVYNWLMGKSADMMDQMDTGSILFELIQPLIKIFSFIIVLVVCYFAFVIFGGIIAAPFNEKISKYIEEKLFNKKIENSLSTIKDAMVSIKEELKKLAFYFSIMIPLILIDFIPMIGSVITLVFGSLFSFFYNALDYLDYPLTRRITKFRNKLKTVGSKRNLSLGFGCIAFILTLLPLINVLLNPILVVSGTRLFYERGYDKILMSE
ncbi:MAG: EI24 domain-containing protein [Ignavibacteria bacterium]